VRDRQGEGEVASSVPSRLRWRCRRGTKELDLLLTGYLETRYSEAPPNERDAFERLTEWSDPDIFAALFDERTAFDEDTGRVLAFLRALPVR
jgi:antitoxin CptB